MYRVSIELYKHEWKFGRTRNAVGTRAAGTRAVTLSVGELGTMSKNNLTGINLRMRSI